MMNDRKLILNIAKEHFQKRDWYCGWATKSDWQKCIFDAVREIYGSEISGTYIETAFALLRAAGMIISDCKRVEYSKLSHSKLPSEFCFEVMDKYYSYSFRNNNGMEIE